MLSLLYTSLIIGKDSWFWNQWWNEHSFKILSSFREIFNKLPFLFVPRVGSWVWSRTVIYFAKWSQILFGLLPHLFNRWKMRQVKIWQKWNYSFIWKDGRLSSPSKRWNCVELDVVGNGFLYKYNFLKQGWNISILRNSKTTFDVTFSTVKSTNILVKTF